MPFTGNKISITFTDFGQYWSPVVINSRDEFNIVLEGAALVFPAEPIWINGSTNKLSFNIVKFDEYMPDNTGILIIFSAELKQIANHR